MNGGGPETSSRVKDLRQGSLVVSFEDGDVDF